MSLEVMRKGEILVVRADGKLDTCGSMSLAHSSYMRDRAPCRSYGLKTATLSGIGGMSEPLRQAGLLHVRTPDGGSKKVLCYAFDKSVGNAKEILLFSLKTIREAKIDIIHHMDQSLQGTAAPLRFLDESSQLPKKKKVFGDKLRATKSFLRSQALKLRKAAVTPIQILEQLNALGKYKKGQGQEMRESHLLDLAEISGRLLAATEDQSWMAPPHDYSMHSVDEYSMLMSEIQLRAIVQNMGKQRAGQQTDGDEVIVKDGVTISKFSREALEVGSNMGSQILGKIHRIFDLNKGMIVSFAQRMEPLRSSRSSRTSLIRMSCFRNMLMAPKDCQPSRR